MRAHLRVTSERPRIGDPVEILGWEGGGVGPELVEYLPGAEPPVAVVWVPGGSVFAGRGERRYAPARIYVFQLEGRFAPTDTGTHGERWLVSGEVIVDFPGSYRRKASALSRSY